LVNTHPAWSSVKRAKLIIIRGGAIVYRVALWHPELVEYLFAVCTPYQAPLKGRYVSLEDMVKYKLPNFGYQIQLSSGAVEEQINSDGKIKEFLNALYGGRGPKGEAGFSPKTGALFENLSLLGPSPLIDEKVCSSVKTLSSANCH
jgi:soluble epoxide hydrolase/lipid-phosphate phosphatase